MRNALYLKKEGDSPLGSMDMIPHSQNRTGMGAVHKGNWEGPFERQLFKKSTHQFSSADVGLGWPCLQRCDVSRPRHGT